MISPLRLPERRYARLFLCAMARGSAARIGMGSGIVSAEAALAQAGVGPGNAAQPNTTIPEKQAPPLEGTSKPPPNATPPKNGVIAPKHDVDPDMAKTPPAQNTEKMPVIQPKGTPGGPPGPEPK